MPFRSVATCPAMLRRSAACALLLVVVSGCEQQEAEPLSTSVPTGIVLFAATAAALWWLVRRSLRRLARPTSGPLAPVRYPRATAALLLGPVLVAGVVASATTCHEVALGFRYEKTSPFSYEDTVGLAVFLAGVILVLVALAGALAVSAQSRKRSSRFIARSLVALVVVALAMPGVGLVWLPALFVMLIEADANASCVTHPPRGLTPSDASRTAP